MHPLLYVFLFISATLYFYGRSILKTIKRRRRFVRLINKIPGPPSYPIVGSVLNFSPNSEKFTYQMEYYFRVFADSGQNEGLIKMWIGPVPIVILTKAEAIKTILESQTLISKPPEYGVIKKWLGEGLLTRQVVFLDLGALVFTGDKWYQRRKILTPTFHFTILQNFIPIFNRQTDVMLQCLEKHEDGRKFDFYSYIKLVALDIISETAMGVNINSQLGENGDYVEAVRSLSELIWHQMRFPWLWLKPIWYGTGMGYEFDRCLEVVEGMSNKVIQERKRHLQEDKENYNYEGSTIKKLAFLDLLLEMQEANKLSDRDIREEVDTFMFEGHDTVSSTMGFFVQAMGQMPHIQDKLYEELDEIFQGEDRDVTMEDLNKMKYLEQCMKETIRILPTVPMIGRRITEETVVSGYTIPVGVTVMVAPFATQRDPRFYPNPDIFNPDNFTLENIGRRSAYSFLPFSAGPRNCIGQKFAMMEQKILLSKLFRKYRVIATLSELENRGLPELILKPSKGFPIRIEPRV
ncbi:hypothetical protein L596_011847 [Steinernema carpocapsae]|uniref:Cytochrome P450 n=1 Tax=Steinernema carpocapsae TaxID=34508 RepID=A0A4U5NVY0_STECR|nr:hypothetical protein L596_011847 [Steinernema carpocapsae]